jgi:hypothetical protein
VRAAGPVGGNPFHELLATRAAVTWPWSRDLSLSGHEKARARWCLTRAFPVVVSEVHGIGEEVVSSVPEVGAVNLPGVCLGTRDIAVGVQAVLVTIGHPRTA